MSGAALLEGPNLLVVEEDESDIPWVCEMKIQPTKEPCPNEPEWVGYFACGCLAAVCSEHKARFEEALAKSSLLGRVTVRCGTHGNIECPTKHAVQWSPL